LRQKADDRETRDEGRSQNYEAEERGEASAAFLAQPAWDGAFRATCFVARLVKGDQPFTAPRFAPSLPETRRRAHVGFNQRFPMLL
jgi:hypothetical protein